MLQLGPHKSSLLASLAIIIAMATSMHAQKLEHVLGDILVELPQKATPSSLTRTLNGSIIGDLEVQQITKEPKNVWLIHVDPNRNNENKVLQSLKSNKLVINAQKNHIFTNRAVPNDPRFIDQWQYINDGTNGGIINADLDMDLAWDITTGGLTADGDSIVVCVIDDGANLDHPDLRANLWKNRQEIPNNGIDDDNNGYVDDFHGWNAYQSSDNVDADGSHGTPVAGIVGAVGNNETGVAGVNWTVKLMIVQGGSPESAAIASYAYAYTMRKRYNDSGGAEGAFVVATNSSWGVDRGQPEDAPIWCDFYNQLGEVGIISCGATANSDLDVDVEGDLPTACKSDYLISVTNIQRDDRLDNAAGYGVRSIDLGAYGEGTYTLTKNNYSTFGGTSAATPHVAGVVGLIYSIDCPEFMTEVKSNPSQAALAVKDYILNGTSTIESLEEITVTNGRLNANNALLQSIAICEQPCSEAAGLFIDVVDLFDAEASFMLTENTGAVEMRYRAVGTAAWTTLTATASQFSLQNLDACTTYEYQSRTECNDTIGLYGYLKTFATEGCCEAPEIIDVSVEENTAILTWSTTVGASQITVEYKESTSDIWNTLSLDGMSTEVAVPNIEDCKAYDFRLMAICELTNRESEFADTQFSGPCGACTTDYCEIEPKDTSDEWIESITIETAFTNTSGDNDGYGSYVGALDIDLEKENEYTIRLTPGYSASAFTELFSVYIDYNQDGIWSLQERAYVDIQPVSAETSGTFTIPDDAVDGITRMRVIMRFSELNPNACDDDSWIYGEYEDYCVNIVPAKSCPSVLEVTSTIDSTSSSLAFEITSSSKIDSFIVDYAAVGGSANSAVFKFNEIVLEGLTACTVYNITFSGTCENGEVLSGSIELKTSCTTSTINLDKGALTVYPNPSPYELHIRNDGTTRILKISIINTSGQVVMDQIINSDDTDLLVFGAGQLEAGIYMINIATTNTTVVKKWLKTQ